MTRPAPRGASLFREIRLLVGPALGSWSKVLQLTLLLVVLGIIFVAVIAAVGGSWPASLINSLLRDVAR